MRSSHWGYTFMKILTKIRLLAMGTVAVLAGPGSEPAWAQTVTNSWTSIVSGHWEDLTWSLGIRPAANQSVTITDSGSKAVAIFPTTPINFPTTMTISDLTVSAPLGYNNTLLLNYSGLGNPLRVLNKVNILDRGLLNSQYGSLNVGGEFQMVGGSVLMQGGALIVTNGRTLFVDGTVTLNQAQCTLSGATAYNATLIQSGGEVQANLSLYGSYMLSNGIFRGSMSLGDFGTQILTGNCYQNGGTNLASLYLSKGSYTLVNGDFLGSITLGRDGSFYQSNSAVTGSIGIGGYTSASSSYIMHSGTNRLTGIGIGSGGYFSQSGGINLVTNGISVSGYFDTYGPVGFGHFSLGAGVLSCSNIDLELFGSFSQSAGTNMVTGQLSVDRGSYTLEGGRLETLNTVISPDYRRDQEITFVSRFDQSGGTHVVSSTLAIYGNYALDGGLLSAHDIWLQNSVQSPFTISSNALSAPVIVNPGQFAAGGILRLSGSIQQLGKLVLTGNSTFDFAQTPGQLRFLDSRATAWTNNVLLTIMNWVGSTNGGGANQLVVGNTAAALTFEQLIAIRFVNPLGFPAGTYVASMLGTGEVIPVMRINSWTGPGSGNWDSLNWSRGVLPAGNHSIFITNAGSKAVAIQPSTPVDFPGSMTIRDLTIGAPAESFNTLLLNFSGVANPLRILEFCRIETNGILNNQYGSVLIDGHGPALTINGQLVQEGGNLRVPEGDVVMSAGTATVQNSMCQFSTLSCTNARFTQIGGTVTNQGVLSNYADYFRFNVQLDAGSHYILTNGIFSGSVRMSSSTFQQYGGTNISTGNDGLTLYDDSAYEMTDGILLGEINIMGGSFSQTNGSVIGYSQFVDDGNYIQKGGSMKAGQIYVDYTGNYFFLGGNVDVEVLIVHGACVQSGGVVQLGPERSFISPGSYTLTAGTLLATSIFVGGEFLQSGGTNVIVDTVENYGRYSIIGGVLSVRNMVLESNDYFGTAELVISNVSAQIITNQGQFLLSGNVILAGSTQELGTLTLAGPSVINFANTPGQLKFLNSSAAFWTNGAILTISNWFGATNGNGANRFVVGNSVGGLTSVQLGQIRFVNPGGLPAGTYFADILATGEIVPTVRPHLQASASGNGLIFMWPAPFTLESSTNVQGPYVGVAGSASPYTNSLNEPRRFFRLKR
ncbi:MAG: Autotransporter-associated beta strand repeat protein [Verrucomicrobiales bacterium]|nr:Autotransporter-associated beta strand repeat protein [Verrucomicrobiales bacterium]